MDGIGTLSELDYPASAFKNTKHYVKICCSINN